MAGISTKAKAAVALGDCANKVGSIAVSGFMDAAAEAAVSKLKDALKETIEKFQQMI